MIAPMFLNRSVTNPRIRRWPKASADDVNVRQTNFMKCFYAPNEDAVGVCKSCGRGLSATYLTEFPEGLACKGRCEQKTECLIDLINGGVKNQKASRELLKSPGRVPMASGFFLITLGGIFIYQYLDTERRGPFLLLSGIAFLVYGGLQLIRGIRIARALKTGS